MKKKGKNNNILYFFNRYADRIHTETEDEILFTYEKNLNRQECYDFRIKLKEKRKSNINRKLYNKFYKKNLKYRNIYNIINNLNIEQLYFLYYTMRNKYKDRLSLYDKGNLTNSYTEKEIKRLKSIIKNLYKALYKDKRYLYNILTECILDNEGLK